MIRRLLSRLLCSPFPFTLNEKLVVNKEEARLNFLD